MAKLPDKKHKEESQDQAPELDDPVLAMVGVGRELWETELGDRFVERHRSEELPPPVSGSASGQAGSLAEAVWQRVIDHQDEEFRTVTGLPFTYQVQGAGMWFYRDGERIERKLSRKQFEIALSPCPLTSTTEIKDLMDFAYLFAALKDGRIRAQAW